jgi:hypothetical protein
MRRLQVTLFALFLALAFQLVSQAASPSKETHAPVLVFVRMFATDPINIELTERRLRGSLGMLEALKGEFPGSKVRATIYVNGAVSDLLAQRNPQTGIRDLLLDKVKKGLIEIGYDGRIEPRSPDQPLVDYRNISGPKEDYLARLAVAGRMLNEGRDPITGAVLPGADGGLKRMQQVFGEAASIWGVQILVRDPAFITTPDLGSDAELVQNIRFMNRRATLTGVVEDIPHLDFVYDNWIPVFSKNLSDSGEASPDIYWQENRLRISERSDKESKDINAFDGVDAFKQYLGKLNREKIRLVVVNIGSDKNYLTPEYQKYLVYPPSNYAAKHPEAPKLPADAFAKDADVSAALQKEQGTLNYLLGTFLPQNPPSRVVGNGDLLNMTEPAFGYRISTPGLRRAVNEAIKTWGDSPLLPKYIKVDESYLSLAQTYQVLAELLVERRRAGKMPESVEVMDVYGPVEMPAGNGAAKSEIAAKEVSLAAVYILPWLYEKNWSPIPWCAVPGQVKVGSLAVNGGQYLRLMMEAFLSDDPDAKLTVRPTQMIWAPEAVGIKTRPYEDMGTIWTIKPAPLRLEEKRDTRK